MPVVAHVTEAQSYEAEPRARAKAVARPARQISARRFDEACERSNLSNRLIARWLGIDEHRVRDMRTGLLPVSLEQVVALPPAVETALGVGLVVHADSKAIGGGR